MNQNLSQAEKLLSSVCYFSVFFAPFIFPIIIWILSDKPTSTHAKNSLVYHIYPYIFGIISFLLAIIANGETIFNVNSTATVVINIFAIAFVLLAIYYVLYNIYAGIKVLLK